MPEIVIKKGGKKEVYQKDKLITSLKRINLSNQTIAYLLRKIDKELPKTITTTSLFNFIFNFLKDDKLKDHSYLKYNLRRAISFLGPSGYPFEKFFSRILNFYNYETKTNIFLSGKCLTYEIDILAKFLNSQNNNLKEQFVIECKFHQNGWQRNDIKTVLYAYGRYFDLKEKLPLIKPWLVTNTKFTSESIKFAECYQIKLTSWDYPEKDNLAELIERKKLYPVTILTTCSKKNFQNFIKFNIILIQDLVKKDKKFLSKITNLSIQEIEKILVEAELLI